MRKSSAVIPAKAGIQRSASARRIKRALPSETLVDSHACYRSRWIPAFAGMTMLLLALSGCADSADKPAATKEEHAVKQGAEKLKTEELICPQTAILQRAEKVSDYGGEAPDPSQLVAEARMKSVAGDCAYRKDGIDIAFTLHMQALRGKRLGSGQVGFPLFIAVVDPADTILNKQILTAQFKFSGSDKTTDSDEPLHVFIPLSEAALQAGPDYRVLVGFQSP